MGLRRHHQSRGPIERVARTTPPESKGKRKGGEGVGGHVFTFFLAASVFVLPPTDRPPFASRRRACSSGGGGMQLSPPLSTPPHLRSCLAPRLGLPPPPLLSAIPISPSPPPKQQWKRGGRERERESCMQSVVWHDRLDPKLPPPPPPPFPPPPDGCCKASPPPTSEADRPIGPPGHPRRGGGFRGGQGRGRRWRL